MVNKILVIHKWWRFVRMWAKNLSLENLCFLCTDSFHPGHWSALKIPLVKLANHFYSVFFAVSLFGNHSTSLTCPAVSLSLSPDSTQYSNMLFSFSHSALCAHLCTSQGRPSWVFHPSPSVQYSTSLDYCTLQKDITDLVTAQATPLPL